MTTQIPLTGTGAELLASGNGLPVAMGEETGRGFVLSTVIHQRVNLETRERKLNQRIPLANSWITTPPPKL